MKKEAVAKKDCMTCLYFNAQSGTYPICEYILLTGHSRKCSSAECREKGVYIKATPKEKRAYRLEKMRAVRSPAPAPREPARAETLAMTLQRPEYTRLMYAEKAPANIGK